MASSPKSRSDDPVAAVERLTVAIDEQHRISGLLSVPAGSRACLVLAHGAGAGMSHPFLAGIAAGLAERGLATLRYQFPYMEEDRSRPDPPSIAHATVRAAVAAAARRTDRAAALRRRQILRRPHDIAGRGPAAAGRPRAGVPRLPASSGRPAGRRARPPSRRSRRSDAVSPGKPRSAGRSRPAAPDHQRLGSRACLAITEDADHSFHRSASRGGGGAPICQSLAATIAAWIDRLLGERTARGRRLAS